ncbi:YutD family protein [Limosilactobacillus sp.]|uniref:YutD family protein n=1 Tax=Limosilactobacillus sp. TaxID=2773925 RepID=UPI0025BB9038|nr:YutD family protein [Limosilactobacillus sp.]MCH3922464.1 YutD family protein [Limosilactobacillus sp.]MCH3927146.1 YutD family protein [Limosilactobacillus sp.]
MNRAKIQDYIDQREEQRADLYHFEARDATHFTLNGHQYELVDEYRDGFDGEALAKRYSNILSKYDYIVGDWGYDQLRLRGFYASDNPLYNPEQGVKTIEDYLYEDCNFGCAYFIIHNEDVWTPRRRRRHRTSPVIKERRKKLRQPDVRHRHHQRAERVKSGHHQQKFVIHKRKPEGKAKKQ